MLRAVLALGLLAVALGCDCDYHSGGCEISTTPDYGYLCQCVYKGAWTCSGHTVGCNTDPSEDVCCQSVPQSSNHACCKEGGGDCGGYLVKKNATDSATDPMKKPKKSTGK